MPSILSKIDWKIKNIYIKSIILRNHILNKYSPDSNIIIFGSGRSGTTWLGEILSNIENATILHEPLMLSSSKKVQRMGFTGWSQYIPEDDRSWKEAYVFFNKLLTGKQMNPNYIKDGLPGLAKTKWWIHKYIRANLLMPWLLNNFNILKPIYLIRNPYAVISSQLKHAGWGKNRPLVFGKPIDPPPFENYNEFYLKYVEKLKKHNTLEEHLTLHWIMQNEYILLHKKNNIKWFTLTYENLLLNPIDELTKILKEYKIPITDKIIDSTRKFSWSSYNHNKTLRNSDINSQLFKWKENLTKEQINLIKNVLDKSKLENFYNTEDIHANFSAI